jgi:glycosyltransferase involved in cell wall biosynthesis
LNGFISCNSPLNEEESLHELYARIDKVCKEHHYTYEIWFVDDGSTDTSWQISR